jgi:hypothetical protein
MEGGLVHLMYHNINLNIIHKVILLRQIDIILAHIKIILKMLL